MNADCLEPQKKQSSSILTNKDPFMITFQSPAGEDDVFDNQSQKQVLADFVSPIKKNDVKFLYQSLPEAPKQQKQLLNTQQSQNEDTLETMQDVPYVSGIEKEDLAGEQLQPFQSQ